MYNNSVVASSENLPPKTWNSEATAMAPDNSHILRVHTALLSSTFIASSTAGSGHFHAGRPRIASVGTRKDIVPPWTIGKRHPNVA